MHKAAYYQIDQNGLQCVLCPKYCRIPVGQTGFCRVRQNVGGVLYSKNYAQCSSCAVDPIEKKPLYHFYPGATIISIGTWGCNFNCDFCQNWVIAQEIPHLVEFSPQKAVDLAIAKGAIGIAYTYSEPSVWFEYVLETAKLAKANGMKNVMVTNGYINQEPLSELLEYIDALNIDVKAFSEAFYRKICSGSKDSVLSNVKLAATKAHVEITNLLIPGLNDSMSEVQQLAKWLASIDSNIPLHFTRYFPKYKLTLPPTPLQTLQQAYEVASSQLKYVYIGNVGVEGVVNTYCPNCKMAVIDRTLKKSNLTVDKKCIHCGNVVQIVGEVYR